MKIHINPKYEHLRDEIINAVKGNYVATEVFCNKRNIVEKFSMQGKEYVIKIYKQFLTIRKTSSPLVLKIIFQEIKGTARIHVRRAPA